MLSKKSIFALCVIGASISGAQAQQAQTPAAACATLKQVASIKLEQMADGRWLVPVGINDKTLKLMLDTASVNTVLWTKTAAEQNLAVTDALPQKPAAAPAPAATGRNAVPAAAPVRAAPAGKVARIATLTLGTVKSLDGYLKVADPSPAQDQSGAAGILGIDLLSHYDFEMDFGAKALNLFSSTHCPGQVVYWDGPVVDTSFNLDSKGQMRFRLLVDGTDLGGMLDTASAQNTMSLVYAKMRANFNPDEAERVAGADPAQYAHRFKSVSLAGLSISNPLIQVIDDSKTNKPRVIETAGIHNDPILDNTIPDVTLGAPFLNKLRIYVEAKIGRLYISPASVPK